MSVEISNVGCCSANLNDWIIFPTIAQGTSAINAVFTSYPPAHMTKTEGDILKEIVLFHGLKIQSISSEDGMLSIFLTRGRKRFMLRFQGPDVVLFALTVSGAIKEELWRAFVGERYAPYVSPHVIPAAPWKTGGDSWTTYTLDNTSGHPQVKNAI